MPPCLGSPGVNVAQYMLLTLQVGPFKKKAVHLLSGCRRPGGWNPGGLPWPWGTLPARVKVATLSSRSKGM